MKSRSARFAPSVCLAAAAAFCGALFFSASVNAVPGAHILRIDPRAGVSGNAPILTTVVELVQFNSPSEALAGCNGIGDRNAALDCWSNAVEKDGALWSPFPFPEANAFFAVKIAGGDVPAKLE